MTSAGTGPTGFDGRRVPTQVGCAAMTTAFPEGFRWGTATAAHQVEGGNVNNDWWAFEHAEGTPCVEPSGDACDQYHRYPEDIALLARKILAESPAPVMIDKAALEYLAEQRWPGNVRELKNVLVRAAALAQDGIIHRADVIGEGESQKSAPNIDFLSKFSDAKEKSIERFERAYLEALMRRTGGNLSKASREADIARHHLRDLLKKRGLYNMSFGEPE